MPDTLRPIASRPAGSLEVMPRGICARPQVFSRKLPTSVKTALERTSITFMATFSPRDSDNNVPYIGSL